jgi:hypothetical protein
VVVAKPDDVLVHELGLSTDGLGILLEDALSCPGNVLSGIALD